MGVRLQVYLTVGLIKCSTCSCFQIVDCIFKTLSGTNGLAYFVAPSAVKENNYLALTPEGWVVGHWGPTPQYLHPVCRSPPYHESQYLDRIVSSHIGVTTLGGTGDASDVKPSLKSCGMSSRR
jgi:hypothetical protein